MVINKGKVIIVAKDIEIGLNEIALFGPVLCAFKKVALFYVECISRDRVLNI